MSGTNYRRTRGLLIILLIGAICCQNAYGYVSDAAVLFLRITNSARANGMGGCVATLADAESAPYNPAGVGIFHLDKYVSISAPNKTKWLPELTSNVKLKSWGASVGASLKRVRPNEVSSADLAVGFAYSRIELDYGDIVETGEQSPAAIGTFHAADKADVFSIGVAAVPHPATRFGIGFSYKKIDSKLGPKEDDQADATAYDLGVLFELRLSELFPMKVTTGESEKHEIGLEVTPSYGFVEANMGDDLKYRENSSQTDRLPKTIRRGPSLYLAISVDEARLFSCRLVGETEKDLASREDVKSYKNGYEFGLFDIVYCRAGRHRDRFGGIDLDSYGFGLSTAGISPWLSKLTTLDERKSSLIPILSHLQITYDFAKYDGGTLSDTKFLRLTASF